MLPHRLHADCVARGVLDHEVFPRLCGDLISGSLSASDRHSWFQSADHAHRNRISLRGVVTEAISNPDLGRGFQICGVREVDLKVRREDSDDSRTKGLPLV